MNAARSEEPRLRVALVIDETTFFHPYYVAEVLRRSGDLCVGGFVIASIPKRHSIEAYLRRNWFRLTSLEILKLTVRKYGALVLGRLGMVPSGYGRTVEQTFRMLGAPTHSVHDDICTPEWLAVMRAAAPDVIISANSLIFSPELLAIPRIACINRHSSLLPSYGGLWPVFQALRSGESEVGASVHVMTPKIDEGALLAQESVHIHPHHTLFELYEECFEASVVATVKALDRIRIGDMASLPSHRPKSYFSFPKPEHWADLRRLGRRFT